MDEDINLLRAHYSALRDLVMERPGGRDDPAARISIERRCEAALAEMGDAECRERLNTIREQARALYSTLEHQRFNLPSMSGADYLRLQILIHLEVINTHLSSAKQPA